VTLRRQLSPALPFTDSLYANVIMPLACGPSTGYRAAVENRPTTVWFRESNSRDGTCSGHPVDHKLFRNRSCRRQGPGG